MEMDIDDTSPTASSSVAMEKPTASGRKKRKTLKDILPNRGLRWMFNPAANGEHLTPSAARAIMQSLKGTYPDLNRTIFDQELARVFTLATGKILSMPSFDIEVWWAKVIEADDNKTSWLHHSSMRPFALMELTGKAIFARHFVTTILPGTRRHYKPSRHPPCAAASAIDAFVEAVKEEHRGKPGVLRAHIYRFELDEEVSPGLGPSKKKGKYRALSEWRPIPGSVPNDQGGHLELTEHWKAEEMIDELEDLGLDDESNGDVEMEDLEAGVQQLSIDTQHHQHQGASGSSGAPRPAQG